MKVKELIESLEILNPDKEVYASVEFQDLRHILFAPTRVDISDGKIDLIIETS
jgi:hypothetical protein